MGQQSTLSKRIAVAALGLYGILVPVFILGVPYWLFGKLML